MGGTVISALALPLLMDPLNLVKHRLDHRNFLRARRIFFATGPVLSDNQISSDVAERKPEPLPLVQQLLLGGALRSFE